MEKSEREVDEIPNYNVELNAHDTTLEELKDSEGKFYVYLFISWIELIYNYMDTSYLLNHTPVLRYR